jgi:hypothetical protein
MTIIAVITPGVITPGMTTLDARTLGMTARTVTIFEVTMFHAPNPRAAFHRRNLRAYERAAVVSIEVTLGLE